MNGSNDDGRRVKTADNLLNIVQYIDENDGAGVSEIADEIELAKSTVHEYMYTLTDRGYFVNQNGQYHLGLRFFEHGLSARERYDILDVVDRFLEQLADETGGGAWFIVEEFGKAVFLASALGEHSMETHARLGKRQHLHCLASGKVILAHMPEEHVYEIIERHGLPGKTSQTITSMEDLFEELAEIRERGYATNDEEAALQVKAIAAPVLSDDDVVLGALSIDGPARWMDRQGFETDFPEMLLSVTDEITLRFDWEEPPHH